MAQFIALVARNYERFTEEHFAPLLEAEAERARELYARGTVRHMWGRLDVKGAVVAAGGRLARGRAGRARARCRWPRPACST